MSKTTIPTGGITADAINGTLIADDAINSEHFTDGSIDTAHIADNQVTAAKATGIGGLVRTGGSSSTTDASTVSVDDVMGSTYKTYRVIGSFETTTDAYLEILYRTGGSSGSDYTGSNYRNTWHAHWSSSGSSGTVDSGDWASASWKPMSASINSDGDDDHRVMLDAIVWQGHANKLYWKSNVASLNGDKSKIYNFENAGWLVGTGTYTGFTFKFNSGNIDSHTVSIYGIVDS